MDKFLAVALRRVEIYIMNILFGVFKNICQFLLLATLIGEILVLSVKIERIDFEVSFFLG